MAHMTLLCARSDNSAPCCCSPQQQWKSLRRTLDIMYLGFVDRKGQVKGLSSKCHVISGGLVAICVSSITERGVRVRSQMRMSSIWVIVGICTYAAFAGCDIQQTDRLEPTDPLMVVLFRYCFGIHARSCMSVGSCATEVSARLPT